MSYFNGAVILKRMMTKIGVYALDPEDNNIYLCERQGAVVGGKIQLYYLPHQLVGHYFTLVEV